MTHCRDTLVVTTSPAVITFATEASWVELLMARVKNNTRALRYYGWRDSAV